MRIGFKDLFFAEIGEFNSVFEFGCHNGFNLEVVQKMYPHMQVAGIDLNEKSIEEGHATNRNYISIGDESNLKQIEDDVYDVVFTCSVLCHLPSIDEIVKELKRITRYRTVLIETNEKKGHWYFPHDYEILGFHQKRSNRSLLPPEGNGAMYDTWEFEK